MSQQESKSEPERNATPPEVRPYEARRTSDMPKQDQLPIYDDDIPPYSYRAQDTAQAQRIYNTNNITDAEYARDPQTLRSEGASASSAYGQQQQQQRQQQQQQMYADERSARGQEREGYERSQWREWRQRNANSRATWQRTSFSFRNAHPALKFLLIMAFVFVVLPIVLRILLFFLTIVLALLCIALGVGAILLFARLVSRH